MSDGADRPNFRAYEPPPVAPTATHPLPKRLENRCSWFTYFMIGPMSMGLNGWEVIPAFDPIHSAADTNDRTETSRAAQRRRAKRERVNFVEEAKMRAKVAQIQEKHKEQRVRQQRQSSALQYKSATLAKISSDSDVRNEIQQRNSRIKNLSTTIGVLRNMPEHKVGYKYVHASHIQSHHSRCVCCVQAQVAEYVAEMVKIMGLPTPDPTDPTTFEFVKRIVSVPESAFVDPTVVLDMTTPVPGVVVPGAEAAAVDVTPATGVAVPGVGAAVGDVTPASGVVVSEAVGDVAPGVGAAVGDVAPDVGAVVGDVPPDAVGDVVSAAGGDVAPDVGTVVGDVANTSVGDVAPAAGGDVAPESGVRDAVSLRNTLGIKPFTKILGEDGDMQSVKGSLCMLPQPLPKYDVFPDRGGGCVSVAAWSKHLSLPASKPFCLRFVVSADELLHRCMQIPQYANILWALSRGLCRTRLKCIESRYNLDPRFEQAYDYRNHRTLGIRKRTSNHTNANGKRGRIDV